MHVFHLLAVHAEGPDQAQHLCEQFLDSHEGRVWDFYELGGRWDGCLGGTNVLCAAEQPTAFLYEVDEAEQRVRDATRRARARLFGPEVGLPLEDFGLVAGPDDEAAHARVNSMYRDSALELQRLVSDPDPMHPKFWMTGWMLQRLGELVVGSYCFDSMFFDVTAYTSRTDELRVRVAVEPQMQFVLGYDLHN